jgi:RNA polymerase sigma factor (sigma-70 family)
MRTGIDDPSAQAHVQAARELLAQAGFARALARKLVWDASQGDDLVQEGWLAVLGRRQPVPGGSARPFWRSVLYNLARQSARSEERRARHETAASAAASETPSDATAQRLDLAERVLRSVRELEEPYRSVITLRYFEELPPR